MFVPWQECGSCFLLLQLINSILYKLTLFGLALKIAIFTISFENHLFYYLFTENQSNDTQRVEIHCSNATKLQQMTEEIGNTLTRIVFRIIKDKVGKFEKLIFNFFYRMMRVKIYYLPIK